jgi:hypothetical protein
MSPLRARVGCALNKRGEGFSQLGESCTVKTIAQRAQALLFGPLQDGHEPARGSPDQVTIVDISGAADQMLRCMS